MFGLLRGIFKLVFILLVILLIAGYFTNPTKDDFAAMVEQMINDKMDETSIVSAESVESGSAFAREIVEKMVTRTNYYVCSIFTATSPLGTEYKYLGALGLYIPLQEKNPLEMFQ